MSIKMHLLCASSSFKWGWGPLALGRCLVLSELRRQRLANGGECHPGQGQPIVPVTFLPPTPFVISAGVGYRETRNSVIIVVLG